MKHFQLRERVGASPQSYALGIKEVWEVRRGRVFVCGGIEGAVTGQHRVQRWVVCTLAHRHTQVLLPALATRLPMRHAGAA